MRTFLLIAGVALASAAPAGKCDVCHLHYYHKEVSTKEVFGADVKQCREYAHESCCTATVAKGVAQAQQGTLYGEGYNHAGCGKLSAKCEQYFVEEGCFYECDKNMGKWRKHDDCQDDKEENGWQIIAMPIKASYCNGWYDACKDDMFCEGPTKNYFELPTCNVTTSCKKFKDIYANGKEVCNIMWGGSFKYEEDEANAYVMSFPEGTENPNNKIFVDRKYPEVCKGHEVNHTEAIDDGCPHDWHYAADSGHQLAGTPAPPSATSGAAGMFAAAAFAAAAMLLA